MKSGFKNLTQAQIIALGFFIMIITGTVLLMLPIASRDRQSIGLVPALFTSASASCVTGLVVADTYTQWSLFGQLVILMLIQIGGLGFVTMGVLFSMILNRKIDLRQRALVMESMNALQIGGVIRLVKKIFRGTIIIESIGAVILSLCFIPMFGPLKGIYYGIFHSVSAFCNAGFDLMGCTAPYSSFTGQYDSIVINITLMALIIIGGIGFIVWDDISKNKLNVKKYMLHTKIVLSVNAVLIFGGALLFYIFEKSFLFAGMSVKGTLLSSLFSSVTARTAGFNTVDTAALSSSSKLLTVMLMFIGGSPGSTAGGVKTTTVAVMIFYVWGNLRSSKDCNIFHRRISDSTIRKAGVIICINLMLGLAGTLAICHLQSGAPISDVLFEVYSAIGTVGMSTGITRELTNASRLIITLMMYCGRVGSMTFALAFTEKRSSSHVMYPEERITVG
ncbi:MAG: TrkH family potassium uptake protein [Clostridia bacterium]|nr:TrkH family potassium uptake protein [Clostridia bacterium]